MDDRRRLLVGLVVGTLLVLSGVFPHPVFGSPYETDDPAPYTHQAVSEDAALYDRLVEIYGFDTADPPSFESLSPTAQHAVERTLEREPEGEWRRYELPVCRPTMLVCDSVREPPADFQYGEGTPEEVFRLIEVDGERYLLQTGRQTGSGSTDGLGEQPLSTYIWLGGLLPFGAVVIASQAISQKTGGRRLPTALTALGGGLVAVGVAVPYLVVLSGVSYDEISTLLAVGVAAVCLLGVSGLVWQTVQYARTEF